MTLQVNSINKKLSPQVEQYARDRIELVVGRFDGRIAQIDLNIVGSKNGDGDNVCTIDVKLSPRGQIHVWAKDNNLYSAIGKAILRAEGVIEKSVDEGVRSCV